MSRPNPAHVPIVVEAELAAPPVTIHPLLLDGILHFAGGLCAGLRTAGGWAANEEIAGMRLPLAQVRQGDRWWFAASQAVPVGPEARHYLHRRPMVEDAGRWTSAKSLNQSQGPDKAMRVPYYRRIGMMRIRWTAIGDPVAVAWLLSHVHGIGNDSTHGHGWVLRWHVRRDEQAPSFFAYAHDARLRHLPPDAARYNTATARQTRLPLTPPYHERDRAVNVLQVTS